MGTLDQYKNLALAQIAVPPSPPDTGTSLTLFVGQAAYLPAAPFNATVFNGALFPTPSNAEIVRVTAINGDVLTLIRAAEQPAAVRSILAGDYVAATFTAKFVTDVTDAVNLTGTIPDARLSANVARTNLANIFTQDQAIAKIRPDLQIQFTGDAAKGHTMMPTVGNVVLARNLVYTGTAWNREDPTQPGELVSMAGGQIILATTPAGANPATLLLVLQLTPTGDVNVQGVLTAAGLGTTPLNASQLTNGTVPDARLSVNIPKLNTSNVFTGATQELGSQFLLRNLSAPADQRVWVGGESGDGNLYFYTLTDAGALSGVVYPLVLTRGGDLKAYGDVREKNRTTPMGHWIDVPYSGSNYSAANQANAWAVAAGGVTTHAYMLVGKTLTLCFYISGTVSPVNNSTLLQIALPPGLVPARYVINPCWYLSTAYGIGFAIATPGLSQLQICRADQTNWPATTATVAGTIVIPLQ